MYKSNKKFNKKNLRQLVSSNGYKVLGVEIYGRQATVTAKVNGYEIYQQFVIGETEFYKAYKYNESVECYSLAFGLDAWYKTELTI